MKTTTTGLPLGAELALSAERALSGNEFDEAEVKEPLALLFTDRRSEWLGNLPAPAGTWRALMLADGHRHADFCLLWRDGGAVDYRAICTLTGKGIATVKRAVLGGEVRRVRAHVGVHPALFDPLSVLAWHYGDRALPKDALSREKQILWRLMLSPWWVTVKRKSLPRAGLPDRAERIASWLSPAGIPLPPKLDALLDRLTVAELRLLQARLWAHWDETDYLARWRLQRWLSDVAGGDIEKCQALCAGVEPAVFACPQCQGKRVRFTGPTERITEEGVANDHGRTDDAEASELDRDEKVDVFSVTCRNCGHAWEPTRRVVPLARATKDMSRGEQDGVISRGWATIETYNRRLPTERRIGYRAYKRLVGEYMKALRGVPRGRGVFARMARHAGIYRSQRRDMTRMEISRRLPGYTRSQVAALSAGEKQITVASGRERIWHAWRRAETRHGVKQWKDIIRKVMACGDCVSIMGPSTRFAFPQFFAAVIDATVTAFMPADQ